LSVVIYTLPSCVQCDTTKRMMQKINVSYREVDLSENEDAYQMVKALGYSAAPVVFAGDDHWSGFRPDRIQSLAA
jgi:glutaredoxin-like protein NrdH